MELLEKILSKDNLNKAYKQVYKNKGASGIDGVTTEELFSYIKEHKEEILYSVRNRKYKPQPVRRVYIPKENGKLRKLGIPSAIDRVIQQAIVQKLTPIYEEQFSNNSFGFRPRRSCEQAVIQALECFNDGYDWIVDIDLQSFFDEVNQDKLMAIIHRTIKDSDVISLIRKFLQSGVMENGVVQSTYKGTPQGGNLSPLLSNIMLNELDKELEARGLNFVRYADDCLIMVKSEKVANRVMESITTFITKKLGLKVNVSIITIIVVLTIGVSYAWFSGIITGEEKKFTISAKELKIIFTDKEEIEGNDIEPGWEDSKRFSVENKSNGTFNYNISIDELVNSFVCNINQIEAIIQ